MSMIPQLKKKQSHNPLPGPAEGGTRPSRLRAHRLQDRLFNGYLGELKPPPASSLSCSLPAGQGAGQGLGTPSPRDSSSQEAGRAVQLGRRRLSGKVLDNSATWWLLRCITAESVPSLAPSAPTTSCAESPTPGRAPWGQAINPNGQHRRERRLGERT